MTIFQTLAKIYIYIYLYIVYHFHKKNHIQNIYYITIKAQLLSPKLSLLSYLLENVFNEVFYLIHHRQRSRMVSSLFLPRHEPELTRNVPMDANYRHSSANGVGYHVIMQFQTR